MSMAKKKTTDKPKINDKAFKYKPGDNFSHAGTSYTILTVGENGLLCKPKHKSQSLATDVFIPYKLIP